MIVFWSRPTSSEKVREKRRNVRPMALAKWQALERLKFIRMSLSSLVCGAVVLGLKAIFKHALKLNQGPFHAFFDKRF